MLDGSGNRVNNALVGFLPLGTMSISKATLITYGKTDAKGFFTTANKVKPGRYAIKVVADSYATLWQGVDIIEVKGGGVAYLKIIMTKK